MLEVLEEVSSQQKFQLAGMRLVDELAFRNKASRVGLGWIKGRTPKAIAISGIEKFEKNSEAIAELKLLDNFEIIFSLLTDSINPIRKLVD